MSEVVIVTGMSGSGKTTALRSLEDLGYFCMDNLPVVLLPKVVDLAGASSGKLNRIAACIDVRDQAFIADAGVVIDELRSHGVTVRILFLDASDDSIIRRFSETRRPHPLDQGGDLRAAVRAERNLLDDIRHRAEIVADSTALSTHELRALVQTSFAEAGRPHLAIRIMSFGFKYGAPTEADLLFDVRFLPNPYFIPELRQHSGSHPSVAQFLLEQSDTTAFLDHLEPLLLFLLPRYQAEGKAYLTIGIGCTGGRHRSVAIAEALQARLAAHIHNATIHHRDRALT